MSGGCEPNESGDEAFWLDEQSKRPWPPAPSNEVEAEQ